MNTYDSRQRGAWRTTPWLLCLMGFSPHRRPIYADWRIGGGFDGWDYAPNPSDPLTTSQEQAAPSASDQRGPQHDQ